MVENINSLGDAEVKPTDSVSNVGSQLKAATVHDQANHPFWLWRLKSRSPGSHSAVERKHTMEMEKFEKILIEIKIEASDAELQCWELFQNNMEWNLILKGEKKELDFLV